ncbi:hypothetical protein K9M47_04555 [Candidatus Gracilibacteria bacterium]|nr:hypothetical protein [Candidatus Gracilibacteria bacterium]MCF7898955.1 hypothetical protein [Candidatus Paceibacterota bacterium]
MIKTILRTTLLTSIFFPILVSAESILSTDVLAVLSSSTTQSVSSSTHATSTSTSSPQQILITCKQSAIEKRDTEISKAKNIYNDTMDASLTLRKDGEKDAVAVLDEDLKKKKMDTVVETYRDSVKNAQEILLDSRKNTWDSFVTELNLCKDEQDEISLESFTQDVDEKTSVDEKIKEAKVEKIELKKEIVKSKITTKKASTTQMKIEKKEVIEEKKEETKSIRETFLEKISTFRNFFWSR